MTCPDTNVWPFMYDREVDALVEGGVRVRRVDADELDPPAVYVRCGIEPLLRVSGVWWAHMPPRKVAVSHTIQRVPAPTGLIQLVTTVLREGRDDGLPQHLDYLAMLIDVKSPRVVWDWQRQAYDDLLEVLSGYRDAAHTVRLLGSVYTHGAAEQNLIKNRYRLVDGGLPWTQR